VGETGVRGDVETSILFLQLVVVCNSLDGVKGSPRVVYWYYFRRRIYIRELLGKEKGSLEGVNVLRFRWPGELEEWLCNLKRRT